MADITTKYAGLVLRNPLIVGSCSLTQSVDEIKKLEANGAAAVVLKSIFEEEMQLEAKDSYKKARNDKLIYAAHSETFDYIDQQIKKDSLDNYVKLIRDTKKKVYIPVIASINCITPYVWTDFAARIQDAGADAVELNIFVNPFDLSKSNSEEIYSHILKEVISKITIPVTIKISQYISRPGIIINNLAKEGAKGIVLFNRFYQSDIDIDKEEVIDGNKYSNTGEYLTSLRWIAMLSGNIKVDLVASAGVHNGETLVKFLLAGAKAVQVVSVLYKNGFGQISAMLSFLEKWMEQKGYGYLDQFSGKLDNSHITNHAAYERIQFMRYFSGIE
jgi:dihydroorotate dehydrogenase (fumarate)